ncbi:hypothetical protein [Antarcticirhabdus aurantiaca]|uniref:Uncharacterized protein n=1 Tax=Antarcticirhabdus aurantiaca TaxID=2606717 RepID=A0ACD4NX55_9HYPH|nr:hypothetical protein [Antarcticirhabdus aurantiaca]WAJ31167.1 hypothetical protein OXU80_13590 [Jeongeuplla avenae]
MIVKSDRDGSFYVAGNSNWRLAGPFKTNAEAWGWVDRNGFLDEPLAVRRPQIHVRQPRFDTSVSKEEVLSASARLLARPLADNERGFVMSMERRARRSNPVLRLTERQARWWKALVAREAG